MARKIWRLVAAREEPAAFQRWFIDHHSPIVARSSLAYVVNIGGLALADPVARFLDGPRKAAPVHYDVAEEIWLADDRGIPDDPALLARAARVDIAEVDETVLLDRSTARDAGAVTPGVKQIVLFRWKAGVQAQQCSDAWKRHFAVVETAHPSLMRYAQDHIVREAVSAADAGGGIGSLHYPSARDYEQTFADGLASYRQVQADIDHFMGDLVGKMLATEHIMK